MGGIRLKRENEFYLYMHVYCNANQTHFHIKGFAPTRPRFETEAKANLMKQESRLGKRTDKRPTFELIENWLFLLKIFIYLIINRHDKNAKA